MYFLSNHSLISISWDYLIPPLDSDLNERDKFSDLRLLSQFFFMARILEEALALTSSFFMFKYYWTVFP